MKTELILIRGIPGSGKSTFAKALRGNSPEIMHYEADMFFMDQFGQYKFDVSKLNHAHVWCQDITDVSLGKGKSVIVSNTFTTKKELVPYFSIAKKYNIKPTVILCQNTFSSIHNVPEETMEKMKNRFTYDISDLFEEFK